MYTYDSFLLDFDMNEGVELLKDIKEVLEQGNYPTKVTVGKDYSEEVEKLVITVANTRLVENTLGLVGEAGEVAEKIKKFIRDEDFSKEDIVKELGDVLFYTTALANHIGSDLQTVLDTNIKKLHDRKKRNKIQGSGDNR